MGKAFLEALRKIEKQMEDPAFVQRFLDDVEHGTTTQENNYDANLQWWTLGDDIAYMDDYDYKKNLIESMYMGSYRRHGNGD